MQHALKQASGVCERRLMDSVCAEKATPPGTPSTSESGTEDCTELKETTDTERTSSAST